MIKFVKKLWGSEEWLVNNDTYCAKHLNLIQGAQCSLHFHKIKDETFYILEGEVQLEIGNLKDLVNIKTKVLRKGDQQRIKPNEVHRFKSLTKTSKILEVSTTHFDEDSYRIIKSKLV